MAQVSSQSLNYYERRGKLLTVLIVLEIISLIQLIYQRLIVLINEPVINEIALLLLLDLLTVILLFGVWRCKRYALVGIIVLHITQFANGLSSYISKGNLDDMFYLPVAIPLIILLIWIWAAVTRWDRFD